MESNQDAKGAMLAKGEEKKEKEFISAESLAIVKATRGLVAENSLKITQNFYPRMFKNNPEVFRYFNKSNQRKNAQPRALADAVVAYAVNIEKLANLGPAVARIAAKHCALNVQAEDYQVVHDNLMASIAEVLGDVVTPEIGAAWSEAVMALAMIFISTEADLYKKAEDSKGGWKGKRNFTVSKVDNTATDTVAITLTPTDGGDIMGHKSGQYISVSVNPNKEKYFAPRHYTLTNLSGSKSYRITTKFIKSEDGDSSHDGIVSQFINKLKVGDTVDCFPPFGASTFNAEGKKATPAIFVSVGIGITPTIAMLPEALENRSNVFIFHGNADSKSVALKDELEKHGEKCGFVSYYYAHPLEGDKFGGLLTVDAMTKKLDEQEGIKFTESEFYICARPQKALDFEKELIKKGVPATQIFREEFGPHKQ